MNRSWLILSRYVNMIHDKVNGWFAGSPEYARIYSKWYGKPQPYWTAKRIGISSGILLLLLAGAMACWRYRALSG